MWFAYHPLLFLPERLSSLLFVLLFALTIFASKPRPIYDAPIRQRVLYVQFAWSLHDYSRSGVFVECVVQKVLKIYMVLSKHTVEQWKKSELMTFLWNWTLLCGKCTSSLKCIKLYCLLLLLLWAYQWHITYTWRYLNTLLGHSNAELKLRVLLMPPHVLPEGNRVLTWAVMTDRISLESEQMRYNTLTHQPTQTHTHTHKQRER